MGTRAASEGGAAAVDLHIRRNTVLLSLCMTALSGMFQLVAAISSLTFVLVTGVEGLLGLGPAIFLVSAALASGQAGRAMDRFGRVPVIASGFVAGAAGAIVTGLGARAVSVPLVITGFVVLGAANGTVGLVRAAGGDLAPPDRRARGIAYVLVGAVFGGVLGPAVFGPIFAGRELEPGALAVPWFASSLFMLAGLVIVLNVRPDPRRIAELIAPKGEELPAQATTPLRVLVRRPGVLPALVAAVASYSVMVGVMNLTGYVVVDHHQHHQQDVFPIIGAHVLGMYALVLFVGALIDRIGHLRALVGGLAIMAASCLGLLVSESVWATAIFLFGLGLGWNFSFVAASAELADRTHARERGKLFGFSDQLGAFVGAALAIVGGVALNELGVAALAIGAAALAIVPALWLVQNRAGAPRPVPD
ncbi:MAG: MFS transporter [Gaiellales bacterium]